MSINLSLCMIVRDNQSTIRPCLESIKPWVDEMVVVDTGSLDETPEIVKSMGARLFHKPWEDDFSAARNFSIDRARGKWIFWMDSDDTISEACGRRLQELARKSHRKNLLGFVMQVRCPSQGDTGIDEFTVVDHVKMFRNRHDLRFEGRIHEQVLMPIRRLGGEIVWTDIYVVHSGADQSIANEQRKIERDLRILRKDLAERPNHPFVLFNFAMTFAEAGRYTEALEWIDKSLAVSKPQESHVPKLYAYLANCRLRLDQSNQALVACKRGREHYPNDPELLFREAMTLHTLDRCDESIRRYREVLSLRRRHTFQSTDPGIRDFKCRYNLGVTLRDAGKPDQAEAQWRRVLCARPTYRPAYCALVQLLIDNARFHSADIEIEKLLKHNSTRVDGLMLKARLLDQNGDQEAAAKLYEGCLREYTENQHVIEESSRFYFLNAHFAKAERLLRVLIEKNPCDASALHNLGAIRLQEGDYTGAVTSLKRSVSIRPGSEETQVLLTSAIRALQHQHEMAISDQP